MTAARQFRDLQNALAAFAETVDAEKPTARPDLMVPFDELNRLMGLDELEALDERYA
jgi:hypothetical protein